MTRLFWAWLSLEAWPLIVEIDLHPHGSERFDEMRLFRKHQPWPIGCKDHLRGRIETGKCRRLQS